MILKCGGNDPVNMSQIVDFELHPKGPGGKPVIIFFPGGRIWYFDTIEGAQYVYDHLNEKYVREIIVPVF